MKPMFGQIGGTYTLQGDYCLPNLTLPAEKIAPAVYRNSANFDT